VEPARDFAQLPLQLTDQMQWRYEVIRPLLLFEDRTPVERAEETGTHPETVRRRTRRFHQQGMLGLAPDDVEIVPKGRATRVPEAVVEEIARLKALYADFPYQELVRIVFCRLGYRITDKTAKQLWQQSLPAAQGALALRDYQSDPDRSHARLEVLKLYAEGWNKLTLIGSRAL